MNQSQFSFTIGIVFLSLGVLGFAPSLLSLPPAGFESNIPLDPSIFPYAQGFGYLFGLFPTNLMHNFAGYFGFIKPERTQVIVSQR
jgi:hypothetical protein